MFPSRASLTRWHGVPLFFEKESPCCSFSLLAFSLAPFLATLWLNASVSEVLD